MTYFSRNSCLYYTPSSGVDFLLVSFLAVSSQSKSSLTQSLHKHCEGMKTAIDWDCSSQCLHGGAGLHCKRYYFSMTISTGFMKKKKKKKKLKRILCKEAIEYCCTCTLNIEYWQNIYAEHLKIRLQNSRFFSQNQ